MASEILGLFGTQSPQQLRNTALDSMLISPAQMAQQGLLQQVVSMGQNAGTMIGMGGGQLFGGKVAGEVEASLIDDALKKVEQMQIKDPADKMVELSRILSANPMTAKQSMIAQQEAVKLKKQGYEMSDLERKQNLQEAMAAIPVDAPVEEREANIKSALRQFGSPAEQVALAKEEAAKAKEAKAVNSRATALVATLGDKVDNETVVSIASDPELYRKIMDDRLKIRDQKTKVITTKGGVWLVEDPSGKKIKYYGLPTSGVTIQNRQESAESSARGTLLVKQYDEISKKANNAAKTRGILQTNLGILDKGFNTGFGTETKAAAASVLSTFGLKDAEKYASNAQMFTSAASKLVLQAQLEQKGPQTEPDARRIEQTSAQLGNTKEANKFILKVALAQANRDIAQRKFYADWHKEYKTYDGAEDAWYEGEGGESLFNRPELKEYAQGAKSKVDQIPTETGAPESAAPTTVAPIYATNGKQRIVSTDGGKTWQEVR